MHLLPVAFAFCEFSDTFAHFPVQGVPTLPIHTGNQTNLKFPCFLFLPLVGQSRLTSLVLEFLQERKQVQREPETLLNVADIARQFDRHLKGLAAMSLGNSWKLHSAWPSSGAVELHEVGTVSSQNMGGGCFQHFRFVSSLFTISMNFYKLFCHQLNLRGYQPFSRLGQDRCKEAFAVDAIEDCAPKIPRRPSHYRVEMEKPRGIRRASECSVSSNQHKAASKDVLLTTEVSTRPILRSFGESKGSWVQLRVFLAALPFYSQVPIIEFLGDSSLKVPTLAWQRLSGLPFSKLLQQELLQIRLKESFHIALLLFFALKKLRAGHCVFGAALVISCLIPPSLDEPQSDEVQSSEQQEYEENMKEYEKEKNEYEAEKQRCQKEVGLVADAFQAATGKKAITKFQPSRDEFYGLIEKWINLMTQQVGVEGSKDFLFYYAGDGCEFERDGVFRFIPADAKRPEDYIPLPGIIAKIEAESKITGCKVVFGIDACRSNLEGEASADIQERCHNNEYLRFFSTPSGALAAHDIDADVSPFAQTMAESIPRITSTHQIYAVLDQALVGTEKESG
eukprot:s107_g52.t1